MVRSGSVYKYYVPSTITIVLFTRMFIHLLVCMFIHLLVFLVLLIIVAVILFPLDVSPCSSTVVSQPVSRK